jgi:hypothetical protein
VIILGEGRNVLRFIFVNSLTQSSQITNFTTINKIENYSKNKSLNIYVMSEIGLACDFISKVNNNGWFFITKCAEKQHVPRNKTA